MAAEKKAAEKAAARQAKKAAKQVVSAEAMEAMVTLASAPAPVRGHKPEFVVGPRAASSTMDQGSALVGGSWWRRCR